MGFEGHISESAFLVNESRARRVDLSRDRYAHLWVSDRTRELWEAFGREVYPYDDIELSLRNRFFLERLERGLDGGGIEVFVNVAAGFTSYPFLVDAGCRFVEVDYPHVVELKRGRQAAWQDSGTLPRRAIEFVGGDLASPSDLARIGERLAGLVDRRPAFFLVEGLSYYLEPDTWRRLLAAVRELQVGGSLLALDFWTPGDAGHPVFRRFRRFFADRLGHGESRYNLFDAHSVRSIPGYRLRELTDVQEQETVYCGTQRLADRNEILPESYAVLERTA